MVKYKRCLLEDTNEICHTRDPWLRFTSKSKCKDEGKFNTTQAMDLHMSLCSRTHSLVSYHIIS